MDTVILESLKKIKEKLDQTDIPLSDRTIIVPAKLNRKTYKGRGRPRNSDYIPVWTL